MSFQIQAAQIYGVCIADRSLQTGERGLPPSPHESDRGRANSLRHQQHRQPQLFQRGFGRAQFALGLEEPLFGADPLHQAGGQLPEGVARFEGVEGEFEGGTSAVDDENGVHAP